MLRPVDAWGRAEEWRRRRLVMLALRRQGAEWASCSKIARAAGLVYHQALTTLALLIPSGVVDVRVVRGTWPHKEREWRLSEEQRKRRRKPARKGADSAGAKE